jgi:hypothetical protein
MKYDGSEQNASSRGSFLHGKHRSEDLYHNNYQGLDEINSVNSETGNQRKIPVSSHYRRHGLYQPSYRSEIVGARRDSKRPSSPDTDDSKEKEKGTEPPGIKYKPPGTSFRSWKPNERRKFLELQYNKTETSSPQYSEEDTFAYEGKQQDAEREEKEELDQNLNFRNEEDEFYDEESDGINNAYIREIDESRKRNDRYMGLQAIYEPEGDGVQRIRDEAPYSARIGTRSYMGDSIYSSPEDEMDVNERAESIHSLIERLKDRTRTQMIKEFGRRP